MTSPLLWLYVAVGLVGLVAGAPTDTVTVHNPIPASATKDVIGTTHTATATTDPEVPNATEGSKMSRFLDDFTSAFRQGTAKMKESLENAASSVKDGVLQGYDYVRSKLTGTGTDASSPVHPGEEEPTPPTTTTNSSTPAAVAALTSVAPSTPSPAISVPARDDAKDTLTAFGGAVGVSNEPAQIVPNDDDDDERIIFNDKDFAAAGAAAAAGKPHDGGDDEREVTETPVPTTVTVDNRFIISGPLACKSNQEVVNGKCRNVF